jgi:hypothetical protein
MNLEVKNLQNNTFPKIKIKRPSKEVDEALEFNIGTEIDPMMVKIGKGTTEKERSEILAHIREFKDTFAWNYDELKSYRGVSSNTPYPW